jgi:hypothetical protein
MSAVIMQWRSVATPSSRVISRVRLSRRRGTRQKSTGRVDNVAVRSLLAHQCLSSRVPLSRSWGTRREATSSLDGRLTPIDLLWVDQTNIATLDRSISCSSGEIVRIDIVADNTFYNALHEAAFVIHLNPHLIFTVAP